MKEGEERAEVVIGIEEEEEDDDKIGVVVKEDGEE